MARRPTIDQENPKPNAQRWRAFVHEYLVDLNAYRAAIRAGYSVRGARTQSCELLAKPYVRAAIDAAMAARAKRTATFADEVVRELRRIGFSDVNNYTVTAEGRVALHPDADADATTRAVKKVKLTTTSTVVSASDTEVVREVTTKAELELWSKDDALGKLLKHLGIDTPTNVRDELPELRVRRETPEEQEARLHVDRLGDPNEPDDDDPVAAPASDDVGGADDLTVAPEDTEYTL